MAWIITKYLITAGIVVLVSEVAKRSDKAGALIGALPTITILAMIWMYIEGLPQQKLSNHAFYTFWYVLPSLPMFLLFPWLYSRFSFWLVMGICVLVTLASFALVILVARLLGIELL